MQKRGFACALASAALLACGSSALAVLQIAPIANLEWEPGNGNVVNMPSGTYGVYTGVATAAGNLLLIEPTAPAVRDDIVAFDGIDEQINDYIAAANSVQRFVGETDVDNGNGTRTLTVTVLGRDALGAPADLWPAGFATGAGTAATSGGFGLGLGLPAALGGTDVFNLDPLDSIQSADVAISTAGTFAAPLALPSTFFNASASYPVTGWNGVIGIAFGNGATGTGVQDGIRLSITYVPVPEPTSLSFLGAAIAGALRRRR